jgi:hypothetical protein
MLSIDGTKATTAAPIERDKSPAKRQRSMVVSSP